MKFSKYEHMIIDYIQLPDSTYEEATARYNSVGDYLRKDTVELKDFTPSVRPQGSFRLGTAIYPQNRDNDLDIDITLMCEGITTDEYSQKEYRDLVRSSVNNYAEQHNMKKVEDKRRCVRLNYRTSKCKSGFHLDIVPSIEASDEEKKRICEAQGIFCDYSLNITDIKSPDYNKVGGKWVSSNPEGYARWFEERMKEELETGRIRLREETGTKDKIPTWKVKTHLQLSVQLLKWHRDCMFSENANIKPVSIIITTLAGMVYKEEITTVSELLKKMRDKLKEMNYKVKNPVDPRENFTDKWAENNKLRDSFKEWLNKALNDFTKIENELSDSDAKCVLKEAFNYDLDVPEETPTIIISKKVPKPYGY